MTRLDAAALERTVRIAGPVVAVTMSAFLLLLPALWNGYALFYYDSVDYVRMAFTWELPVWRTMPYALVAALGRVAGSLWIVPVLQCLVMAWVLHEAVCAFSRLRPAVALVPLTGLLVLFTGLPWFASQVMADVFAGIVVLGIAILAFGADRIGARRAALLAAIVALGGALHTSHMAVGGGLVLCLVGLRAVVRRRWPEARPRVALAAAAVIASVVLVASVHWVTVGRPFVTQPNAVLLLGRLVQDGIAKRYLDDMCPRFAFKLRGLCAVRALLPPTANHFLWGRSPFHKLGGWRNLEPVADEILEESIERYPLMHLVAALRLWGEQLVMVETGDGVVDMRWHLEEAIAQLYPRELKAFLGARQQSGDSLAAINALHVPVLVLAMLATVVLTVRWARSGEARAFGLGFVVVMALLGNAFVCGALSNPNHRYQSRVAWLCVLVVAAAAARRFERVEADGRVTVGTGA